LEVSDDMALTPAETSAFLAVERATLHVAGPHDRALNSFELNSSTFERHFKW
jgi:hypothetical protein